jgi:hypothetical protein
MNILAFYATSLLDAHPILPYDHIKVSEFVDA